jgi:hypothetical protein
MKSILSLLLVVVSLHSSVAQNSGCTDASASNYNPNAMVDDGSCCYGTWTNFSATGDCYVSVYDAATGYLTDFYYPQTQGWCGDFYCVSVYASFSTPDNNHQIVVSDVAGNVLASASTADGITATMNYNAQGVSSGCSDYFACNYDPSAYCYNYSNCDYSCFGCIDSTALNYEPNATVNNGSCCYGNNSFTLTFSDPTMPPTSYQNWSISSTDVSGFHMSGSTGQTFCLQPGCYYLDAYSGTLDAPVTLTLTDAQGNLVYFLELTQGWGSGYFSYNENLGCIDPGACNYDPTATCTDPLSCTYGCFGCTDPAATNYNPDATIDNGTCCLHTFEIQASSTFSYYITSGNGQSQWLHYPEQSQFCIPNGCNSLCLSPDYPDNGELFEMNITGINGNSFQLDTSVTAYACFSLNMNVNPGCMDINACNFNADANCNDYYSCTFDCYGCTDTTALNYDAEAQFENGTCCYTSFYQVASSADLIWYASSSDGSLYASGNTNNGTGFCFDQGCLTVTLYANTSLVSAVPVQLNMNGNVVAEAIFDPFLGSATISLNVNGIEGCADYYACNYDPLATCPNYSLCSYDCYGCTDESAQNYNADATIDNGTCCFSNFYQISSPVEAVWSAYASNGSFYTSGNANDGSGFCFDSGCAAVSVYPLTGSAETFNVQLLLNGQVVQEGSYDPLLGQVYFDVSNNAVVGCLDYYSCNYEPSANCADNSLCIYDCLGCTDPTALNYNPDATIDIGNCCYTNWYTLELSAPGNWYIVANNSGWAANGHYPEQSGFCMDDDCFILQCWSDDGNGLDYMITDGNGGTLSAGNIPVSFGYVNVVLNNASTGCGDYNACNYDSNVQCSDASMCDYSCYGCNDPAAANYEPGATMSDGSCCYNSWLTVVSSSPIYFYVYEDGVYYQGDGYNNSGFCHDGGCFSINVFPLTEVSVDYSVMDANGNLILQGTAVAGQYSVASYSSEGEIAGCLDSFSCNYNAAATCDDGSCYACYGCTDPTALNYDASAYYDDGACFYEIMAPAMGMTIIPDEDTTLYWIMLNVTSTGNGAPYIFQNGDPSYSTIVNAAGQYMTGPYSCMQTYNFNLVSMAAQMTEYMAVTIEESCSIASGIGEISSSEILLFPNPANDQVQITGSGMYQLEITDLQGRVIETQIIMGGGTFDVSEFPNGLYFARISNPVKSETLRFVIRH